MSLLLYQLKCLFGPNGCSCLCFSPIRESITTRMMYSLMLIVVSVLSIFTHDGRIVAFIFDQFGSKINETCVLLSASPNCTRLYGYVAVYRIAFSFTVFHLLMMALCLCVSTSQDYRARIHNGFWFFKILLLIGIWILLYSLPHFERFINVATIVGVASAFIFIVIQQVSLIDCAYEFNQFLREENQRNCCYGLLLFFVPILLYLITVSGYVFIIVYFALNPICVTNRILVIVNASASFLLVIFSFFVRKHRQRRLYIPGAVISVFVVFLTWSAISSAPYEVLMDTFQQTRSNMRAVVQYGKKRYFRCKPDSLFFESHIGNELHSYIGIFVMLTAAVYSSVKSTVDYERFGIKPARSKTFSTQRIPTIAEDVELQEISVKTKNRRSGSHLTSSHKDSRELLKKGSSMPALHTVPSKQNLASTADTNENIKFGKCPIDEYLIHDEYFGVRYSYSWLHFVFAIAYQFVMVQLTNWYSPETSHIQNFALSWPSMWMKSATCWIALGLFAWTLICPAFCVGRNLYEYPLDSLMRLSRQRQLQNKKADNR